jgi:predicted DNA-binding transcriptional regulator AlpA
MRTPSTTTRRLVPVPQIADQLGVSKSWIYAAIRRDTFPGVVRLGEGAGRSAMLRTDVDQLHASMPRGEDQT